MSQDKHKILILNLIKVQNCDQYVNIAESTKWISFIGVPFQKDYDWKLMTHTLNKTDRKVNAGFKIIIILRLENCISLKALPGCHNKNAKWREAFWKK